MEVCDETEDNGGGGDELQDENALQVARPKRIELQFADRKKTASNGYHDSLSFYMFLNVRNRFIGVRSICYPRNSKGASAKPFGRAT